MHFLLVIVATYFLLNQISAFAAAIIVTLLTDWDHLPLIKRIGIHGYWKLRTIKEVGKPRKYFFHNLFAIAATFIVGSWELYAGNILYAVGVYAIMIHLFWDFFEDVAIFRMGFKHWL